MPSTLLRHADHGGGADVRPGAASLRRLGSPDPLHHRPPRSASPLASWQAALLMALSGAAALGYQIVWTRQCAVWVGQEAAAVLAVIAALFGGMALGAALARPRARHALAWYAGCEAAIALWATALLAWLPAWGGVMQQAVGLLPGAGWQWSLTFFGTGLLLLPASTAMGATLPAIGQVLRAADRGPGDDGVADRPAPLALPYAANTAGAVIGVLASAYGLLPGWGAERTALACIALNACCALLAWCWHGRVARTADRQAVRPARPARAPAAARADLARLAASGLLGIGYEVLVVRVLGQVSEGTVYTYANLLAVYLVGTALGAAWLARRPARLSVDRLLALLALACLLGGATLWAAEALHTALRTSGGGLPAALAAEAAPALLAFGLPTFLMGALFARLCERVAGRSYGAALAANTAGAALAPALFGVVLVPVLGPRATLVAIALGYLALIAPRRWRQRHAPAALGLALAGTGALAVLAPPLRFVEIPIGGELRAYREGASAAVSVTEDADGTLRLRIDNHQQEGSSRDRYADARQAWLPLLLHPAPQRALFLGLGTGVTAASAAVDPALAVTAVELLPEVVATAPAFIASIGGGAAAARLEILTADARRYVATTARQWDVIVADNVHPGRNGSASLTTAEHFEAVRRRLATGGVFCQWLPLHQLDRATLRSIVAAFRVAFPGGSAVLATLSLETPVLGLVGTADGHRFDPAALRPDRLSPTFAEGPDAFGLDDGLAVLGSFVAGPSALARLAGDAPPNTDDHPVVAWLAPRATYVPEGTPADRLLALLADSAIEPGEVLADDGASPAWRARWTAWRAARDRFLAAGRGVRPSADPHTMLAQVRAPLLAVLDLSPDFEPARRPLERLAAALASREPAAADALRGELAERARRIDTP